MYVGVSFRLEDGAGRGRLMSFYGGRLTGRGLDEGATEIFSMSFAFGLVVGACRS